MRDAVFEERSGPASSGVPPGRQSSRWLPANGEGEHGTAGRAARAVGGGGGRVAVRGRPGHPACDPAGFLLPRFVTQQPAIWVD